MAAPDRRRPKDDDSLVDWFTVSYRSIYLAVGLLALVAGGVGYYYWSQGAPASTATATATPATITAARFTTLEGNVKVKTVGTFEWVNADRAMLLRKSDLVRTGPGGAAEIAFFDGTLVHVRPDSLITIESEDPSTNRRRVAWHISSGEVQFNAPRPTASSAEREISTPTLTRITTREAATGGVAVQESGESNLRLYTGTASVETKTGETLQVAANTQLKVDAAGNAAPLQNLPSVPVLLAPQHQAEITYQDPARATTLLLWKPVPGASAYHVMLDYNAYFNRPLVDRGGIGESSVEVRGLDSGKYYWRVAAVDKDGVEGSFSDFARFTVSRPQGAEKGGGPPPPLVIDALEVRQSILQVRGRTEPGATLTVNGQRVDVAGDGAFNEFIQLPAAKPGRQLVVIRSVGINGGVRETKRPVMVGE
ncbi:MAG TPA: FecR domain-containing protein [Vicinamibacteria bacterium]|nr:FecR domain-containing protein [Vicinamibacteria bacterium]